MPGLVLDASVALAWALPAEVRADAARNVLLRIAEEAAVVPAHWRLEVGNGLLMGERRGRLLPGQVDAVWRHMVAMPIEIDQETNARAWSSAAGLARKHGLTLYDAAYLELAARRGLPLATFDAALARAAGVETVALAA